MCTPARIKKCLGFQKACEEKVTHPEILCPDCREGFENLPDLNADHNQTGERKKETAIAQ